jgi:hypothetical protein
MASPSSPGSSSSSSPTSFDIRLLSSSGDKRMVRLSPDTTLEELTTQTLAWLALSTSTSSGSSEISFLAGFPPVPLLPASSCSSKRKSNSNTRVSTLVRPNETLRVVVLSNTDNSNSNSKSTNKEPTKTKQQKRPKRAAAEAATRAFPAVIQAQDQLLSQDNTTTTKPTNKKRGRKASKQTKPKTKQVPKWGTGQALGVYISSSSNTGTTDTTRPTPRRSAAAALTRRPRSNAKTLNSEEDVSTTLLGALNGGGGGGTVGGVLRRAMRNAVVQSYEQSRASVRVSAVQSGRYSIQIIAAAENNNDDLLSLSQEARITYDKGMEGRGTFEEEVQLIPEKALTEVIQMVFEIEEERELLRPITLAQLSPRVFWSLIHHHTMTIMRTTTSASSSTTTTTHDGNQNQKATNVPDALQQLLPDLDWTFLTSRTKTLSAKALENLRQKNNPNNDDDEPELGERAVEAVAEAMERYNNNMTSTTATTPEQLRARAARAALDRLTTTQEEEEEDSSKEQSLWKLVTPTELDKDELRHCITEAAARRHHASTSASMTTTILENHVIDPQLVETWVEVLVTKCHIHNWRELANYKNREEEQQLNMSLADMNHVRLSRSSLEDCGVEDNSMMVEGWLEVAREESVEEIMYEICNGSQDALVQMRERARTGTPHDLSLWTQAPDLLFSQLHGLDKDDDNDVGRYTHNISVDMVRTWCQRAQTLLQHHPEFEWLHWYATPIS